jgi:hypothetical protein
MNVLFYIDKSYSLSNKKPLATEGRLSLEVNQSGFEADLSVT